MTRILAFAASAAFALSATVVLAAPQIPTPVNPFPAEPVATDGSPLPVQVGHGGWALDQIVTGRSVGVERRTVR